MRSAAAKAGPWFDGAQRCEAAAGRALPGFPGPVARLGVSTPARDDGRTNRSELKCGEASIRPQKPRIFLRWAPMTCRNGRAIREKIIGHRMRGMAPRFAVRRGLLNGRGPLALLHQPAGQHGRGIFLHPLVHQRADLLAEIGGMAQPRQFIALQTGLRSREKELPRRLGLVNSHEDLLKGNRYV